MPDADIQTIKRFVEIAQRGRYPGASHGEWTAHRLAKAIHEIGDNFAILDSETLQGAQMLMELASGPWPTDRLRNWVFETIAKAAQ